MLLSNSIAWLAALVLVMSSQALAQQPAGPIVGAALQARDLVFPSAPLPLSEFSNPRMAILKPDGPGPFPALVLHHQCGGLRRGQWHNQSMLTWTRMAVERGFVVLLLDSLGPRGVDWVCTGPKGGVNLGRGVRDALQGAEHLRSFAFVDKKRIAHVGFSWGAMVGLLANSASFRYFQSNLEGFAAFVSFYPGCFTIKRPDGSQLEVVRSDTERPHLVLMGDQDTETPARECAAKLDAAKSSGASVKWHIFANATHCWDCENLDGLSKIDVRGNRVAYHYDAAITAQSQHHMFQFLAEALSAKP